MGSAGVDVWWLAAAGCGEEIEKSEPIDEATADWEDPWAEFEDEVIKLVNRNRYVGATCGSDPMPGGLVPLESDEILRSVARLHSLDMAERDFFDHVNPDGEDPFDRIADSSFGGADPWGENIAFGAPTPEIVVDLWMESPGHCANIMLADFHVIGVGYYLDETDSSGHFWTQNFAGSH